MFTIYYFYRISHVINPQVSIKEAVSSHSCWLAVSGTWNFITKYEYVLQVVNNNDVFESRTRNTYAVRVMVIYG